MKTTTHLWLFLASLLCFFQIQAQDFRTTSADTDFEVVDGVLVKYYGEEVDIVIPSTLGITAIGGNAFDTVRTTLNSIVIPQGVKIIESVAFVNCGNLTSVSLPNTLERIGFRSFQSCRKLASISIPNSVTTIEAWAFSGCSSLTEFAIPKSVEYLEEMNFEDCNQLTAITVDIENPNYSSVEGVLYDKNKTILYRYPVKKSGAVFSIPNGVTTIFKGAFSGCSDLTSITIPNSVKYIREGAFISCSGLTALSIPNLVEIIEGRAFEYCTQLASINVDASNSTFSSINGILYNKAQTTLIRCPQGKTELVLSIPNTVKNIAYQAFLYCNNITSVIMQNTLETIEDGAFFDCANLASISLSNSLVSIGKSAFYGCTALTSVVIPASVENIGEYALLYCLKLTAIDVEEGNKNYSSIEGVFYNKEQTILYYYPASKKGDEFLIPNSVTEIAPYAFYYCSFNSLVIPNSIQTIGSRAFNNCINLEDITVYWATPISIPDNAFDRWSEGPFNLYVPVGTTSAYTTFFASWYHDFIITEQAPPTGVSLDITDIYIPVNYTVKLAYTVSPRNASNKNVIWSSNAPTVATVSSTGIITAKGEGTATITATTVAGGFEATCGVTVSNTDFIVINSVLVAYCGAGGNVIIPDNLGIKEITESVFEGNTTISSVSIPEGVIKIDKKAFYNSSLTSVSIPSSVTHIEYNVFEECRNLSAINIDSENPYYASIDGVFYSKYLSFLYVYPAKKAGSFSIPYSVMYVTNRAFSNCSGLTSIRIPNSVAFIGESAFSNCSQLTDFTVCWAIPLSDSEYALDGFNAGACTLHVPAGTKTEYESHEMWKKFRTIIDDVPFISVASVSLNKSAVTLFANDTELLIPTVLPEDALNKNVSWSSSNLSVVTVSEIGLLTVTGEGTARITVTTSDGNYSDYCDVTVRQPLTMVWQGSTGTNGTNWNNPLNWLNGQVPANKDIVKIPGNAVNFPVLSDITPVGEIYFAPCAQIGNQSLLRGKAFVSYDLSEPNRWHMLSIPVRQAYPGDFTFGGFPLTWVRTFKATEPNNNNGSVTTGSWVTAQREDTPFTTGDGFVLWLNEDNLTAEKGLKILEGIHEIPYFHHQAAAAGSVERVKFDKIYPMHEYDGKGKSTFYNFKLNDSKTDYEKIENDFYPVVRSDDAYRLAGGSVFKTLNIGENDGDKVSKFSLIGNPYMATLNFNQLSISNSSVIKGIYHIWTEEGYASYFSPTGDPFGVEIESPLNEYIAPLQGFIVERTFVHSTLQFYEWMTTVDKDVKLHSTASKDNKLDIVARNPVAGVRTFIAKREGGQKEFGNLDARKIINKISNVPEIYTLKEYNGGKIAAGVNIINNDDLLIPLGLATNYSGNIKFTFTGMDNYNAKLSFLDTDTDTEINLTGSSQEITVNFTPRKINGEDAACEDRFFIRISKTNTGLIETLAEKINVYESNGLIQVISGISNPLKEISVYDMRGMLIYKANANNAVSHAVDRNWAAGAYIVRVISEKGVDNVKIVM